MNEIVFKLDKTIHQLISGEGNLNLDLIDIDSVNDEALKSLAVKIVNLAEQYKRCYRFIIDLSFGRLDTEVPSMNVFAYPFKQLHAELRHLTWQIQQIADGDYEQYVSFLGDFSDAINKMIVALRGRKAILDELEKSHELLEKQKNEITESIRYASIIQKATLPTKEYTDSIFPEYFIYNNPRDILSGDFYWFYHIDDYIIAAVADCTGHGVPGAIVSMLGISELSEIVRKMKELKADEILNELRNKIIHLLHPAGSNSIIQDGMDIALVILHTKNRKIEYAGANNPLYLVRDGQLIEKKANKMPIGIYILKNEPFIATSFDYFPGDTLYMFSDGYVTQFGGEHDTKFNKKNFKELLLSINDYSMAEQAKILDKTHRDWKGMQPQIDDILVVGVRLA